MPTTIKNLGHATAYAFAVAGGYRGTIQEFEAGLAASANYASNAEASSLVSEGFATGTQDGSNVGSQSPYYHNNAEYYAGLAQQAAQQSEGNIGHAPTIIDGYWHIWDVNAGSYVNTNIYASAGIYVGDEAPTNPSTVVWIDTTRESNVSSANGVNF